MFKKYVTFFFFFTNEETESQNIKVGVLAEMFSKYQVRIRQLTLEKLQNKAKTHSSDWFPLKYVVRLQLNDAYLQRAVLKKAADGWWGPPSHEYPISTEEPASYSKCNGQFSVGEILRTWWASPMAG